MQKYNSVAIIIKYSQLLQYTWAPGRTYGLSCLLQFLTGNLKTRVIIVCVSSIEKVYNTDDSLTRNVTRGLKILRIYSYHYVYETCTVEVYHYTLPKTAFGMPS